MLRYLKGLHFLPGGSVWLHHRTCSAYHIADHCYGQCVVCVWCVWCVCVVCVVCVCGVCVVCVVCWACHGCVSCGVIGGLLMALYVIEGIQELGRASDRERV